MIVQSQEEQGEELLENQPFIFPNNKKFEEKAKQP